MSTFPGGLVSVPVGLFHHGHAITALVFSFDLDPLGLTFDPTDDDMDGVPDAVTFPQGRPEVVVVAYDGTDPDGELDLLVANLSGAPLPEGIILAVEWAALQAGRVATWMRFSDDPPPSFGNEHGQDVEGDAIVLDGSELFADGFESGDTCAWSVTVPENDPSTLGALDRSPSPAVPDGEPRPGSRSRQGLSPYG